MFYDVSSRFMVWRKVKLTSRFSKNKKSILDFGCGRGGFLMSAKKPGFEVCGVDVITAAHKELEK